jgi:hypothetical protein
MTPSGSSSENQVASPDVDRFGREESEVMDPRGSGSFKGVSEMI